jgi:hypothetical protein
MSTIVKRRLGRKMTHYLGDGPPDETLDQIVARGRRAADSLIRRLELSADTGNAMDLSSAEAGSLLAALREWAEE